MKKIFIIDDDPIYRMITSITINKIDSSVKVNECDNGKVGLEELRKLTGSTHEIIVLLDINMPFLNGWEFLEEIEKANYYKLSQLNVYMVSSSTDESDLSKAKEYDIVKDFYHKPLESDIIRNVLTVK